MMDENPHVLVIGAAAVDTKGTAQQSFLSGVSTPGRVRNSVGGVGRNIAENLSRLGIDTTLMTAVGDDEAGQRVLRQAAEAGIDTSPVLVAKGCNTGAYMALFHPDGSPMASLYDMTIVSRLAPRYIYDRRRLFEEADFVVIDANLAPAQLETVFKLAEHYETPVGADPTSVALAPRLRPHLARLRMITPDRDEAAALAEMPVRTEMEALEAAKRLVAGGVEIAIVTMAEEGVCYATPASTGRVPAVHTEVVDMTGAGDALTAAVVFGLLNDFSVDEAVRLGVSAGSLALKCRETVCPELSLQRLYDNLVI